MARTKGAKNKPPSVPLGTSPTPPGKTKAERKEQYFVSLEDREAHRKHYADMEIDTIDLMLANASPEEIIGFLRYNAMKYLMRAGTKNGKEGTFEDVDKAVVYSTWLKEYVRHKKLISFRRKTN